MLLVSFCFMVFFSCNHVQGSSPAMFVFGDCSSDVGNNNYLHTTDKCDFPPYGIDYPGGVANGRCNNGKNVADFLADKLGIASPEPYLSLMETRKTHKFLQGVNFASSGAGILSSTYEGLCISMDTQIDYYSSVFEALVEKMDISQTQWLISRSIFMINIGSVDILVYNGTSSSNYVSLLISTLEGQLKRIYDLGARKFVFMGIEPVGCWPALRAMNKSNGDCNIEANQLSFLFNEQAAVLLQKMQSEFADMNYSFFDSYRELNNYINYPKTYGFKEAKAACCGMGFLKAEIPCNPLSSYCSNRTEYVFWDNWRQTEATAKLLVSTAFDGSPPNVFPVNVKQLSGFCSEINAHVVPFVAQ
ncbi:GDSL esterase/lipase At5g55050-like [Dioscorea cayenensis subsp. rotundata]|uniref:GDSL esterase/lipase At5g55050-like n=1 Tax=Dioscorea cayennensis subsp. rotundata TaxID=55577 RepID=A0AB40AZ92_DIOCR|nr:GDSL esterase/lipase At5g55050-like [Dioscorea cayenensis subsp. rotundata]